MIGALVAASGVLPLDAVLRAVQSEMHAALAEKNGEVLRRCHDLVRERRDV
jgi:Pyruvate/2-oxoacid:ferredoxin oxidoreductase gamma subunit